MTHEYLKKKNELDEILHNELPLNVKSMLINERVERLARNYIGKTRACSPEFT